MSQSTWTASKLYTQPRDLKSIKNNIKDEWVQNMCLNSHQVFLNKVTIDWRGSLNMCKWERPLLVPWLVWLKGSELSLSFDCKYPITCIFIFKCQLPKQTLTKNIIKTSPSPLLDPFALYICTTHMACFNWYNYGPWIKKHIFFEPAAYFAPHKYEHYNTIRH